MENGRRIELMVTEYTPGPTDLNMMDNGRTMKEADSATTNGPMVPNTTENGKETTLKEEEPKCMKTETYSEACGKMIFKTAKENI